jgi:acyl-CoA dehydrogenase
MDFGYDARTLDLRKRLLAFMDERVYPAEAVFEEQVEAAVRSGHQWERAPVTSELKAEARSRGLWNLFLTGKAASAVANLAGPAGWPRLPAGAPLWPPRR